MSVFADIKSLTGTRYHRAEHNADILDDYYLRAAQEKGIRLPTANENKDPEYINYLGAHVETPTAGISEHVFYLDLSSLYPNTMRAENISPETVIGTQEEFEKTDLTEDEVVWGYIDTRDVKWLSEGETYSDFTNGEYKMVYDPNASSSKVKWTTDEPRYERCYFVHPDVQTGFVTELVEDLLELKYKYEGAMYEAIKRISNCYSSDTEVLTPEGVCNIRDLEIGDEVYSINPDTNEMEVKAVTETFTYPDYEGKLYQFSNEGSDLLVTPNHKMVLRSQYHEYNGAESYDFYEAEEIDNSSAHWFPHDWGHDHGEGRDTISLDEFVDSMKVYIVPENSGTSFSHWVDVDMEYEGSYRKTFAMSLDTYIENKELVDEHAAEVLVSDGEYARVPLQYDADAFCEFVGWFVAEGHIVDRGDGIDVKLTQRKTEGRQKICDVLDRMNVDYTLNGDREIRFSSKPFGEFCRQYLGVGATNKRLPEFVFDLSREQKELVFEAMMDGDGCWEYENSGFYVTKSDELRDDFMRLLTHLGRQVRYRKRNGSWRVSVRSGNVTVRGTNRETVEAEDGVYCVEVEDNHTLLAGRNGKFQFCGNSVYGTLSEAGENKCARLYDWRMAESITLTGRKVIQYTRDKAIELLKKRGYENAHAAIGDTDGIGISLPSADGWEDSLEDVVAVVEQINDEYYPEWMHETFGVDRDAHYMEVEVESYARRLFVPSENPSRYNADGSKKRYAQWMRLEDCEAEQSDVSVGSMHFETVDDISIKGVEAIRSDTSDATTDVQKCVLEQLVRVGEDAQSDIFEVVGTMDHCARKGTLPPSYLAARGGLSKDPSQYGSANRRPQPIYRGAKWANDQLDAEIGSGDKPQKYAVSSVGSYRSTYRAKTAEDGDAVDYVSLPQSMDVPPAITIDYDTMADKAIKQPLKPILETMGWSYGEVQSGTIDTSLEQFM